MRDDYSMSSKIENLFGLVHIFVHYIFPMCSLLVDTVIDSSQCK